MRRIKTKFLGKDKALEIDNVPYVCVAVSDYRKLVAVARAADDVVQSKGRNLAALVQAVDKFNCKPSAHLKGSKS